MRKLRQNKLESLLEPKWKRLLKGRWRKFGRWFKRQNDHLDLWLAMGCLGLLLFLMIYGTYLKSQQEPQEITITITIEYTQNEN